MDTELASAPAESHHPDTQAARVRVLIVDDE